jgi:hypothetical protein
MTDGSTSLLTVLSSDHHSIASALTDPVLERGGREGALRREQVVSEIVRHFVGEEQYLYPAVRDRLPGGASQAERDELRDRAIERQLRELERELDGAAVADVLTRIARAFETHIGDQEPQLAALRESLGSDELDELGRGVLGAEQLAPTRPRSVAPEQAGLNKVVSLVEGFVDKVRDHYTGRGELPETD